MVTLIPTSITNKDMDTLNPAMATTPCMATPPPTMAWATLVVTMLEWLTMELLTTYQQDMEQAMELLSHLWGVDLDMAMDTGTDTVTSATTRSRENNIIILLCPWQ